MPIEVMNIVLDEPTAQFYPGEEVTGHLEWQLASAPRTIELRLYWTTRGKGTTDSKTVEALRFDAPAASARQPFRLQLPECPYSFSGKLISLIWKLEMVALPARQSQCIELTMGPGAREVLLPGGPEDR